MQTYYGTQLSGAETNVAEEEIENIVKEEEHKQLKNAVGEKAFKGFEKGKKFGESQRQKA